MFATKSVPGNDSFQGLFYGGGASLLGKQALGVLTVAAWTAVTMTIVFLAIKATIGLRASKQEEIIGLDATEHGLVSSYADFAPAVSSISAYTPDDVSAIEKITPPPAPSVPVEKAVEVENYTVGNPKITKVVVVFKQQKLQEFIAAMESINVTGITVTNVLGCGMQKGQAEFYRGVEVEANLLPKIKAEVVVCKVPVKTVVETAKSALYTGHIGDGKIFIYDIENVVKVRTGEEGYDALQDD